jgi:hypothetical protein
MMMMMIIMSAYIIILSYQTKAIESGMAKLRIEEAATRKQVS